MAINVRLPEDLAAQLRAMAERTHRSQTSLIIEAVRCLLTRPDVAAAATELPPGVTPPRIPYYRSESTFTLPDGVSVLDLLDRDDRI